MSIITFTTDFGTDSPYVAQMKAAVLAINRDVTLVDITHGIPPQDVALGALMLADTAVRFPAGTVHVAVVDPGVGTDRRIVAAKIDDRWLVAPDNGLLTGVAQGERLVEAYSAENSEYWAENISATFHGRDIMAPVAAHLSRGVDPAQLGPRLDRLVEIDWPHACKTAEAIEGEVLAVDAFGNLITNITEQDIATWATGGRVTIACADHVIHGLSRTYAERPAGTLTALVGSAGRLEVAQVAGSAARRLGAGRGARVALTRKSG